MLGDPRRGAARFFLLAFAGALLLAVAERGTRAFLASRRQPGIGGSWIWAAAAARVAEPTVFFAVGDFDLAAAAPGRISIAAADSYDLYLNGRPVGANSYRAGMAIDRYRVGELLRAGRNRITVGLRSGSGAGGLLATLVVGERTVAATGDGWRIFRRLQWELFDADATLAGGEAPRVWPRPPTGRWRLRPAESDRPSPFAHRRLPPLRFPTRFRVFHPGTPWKELRRRQPRLPTRNPRVLLDWGREVTGFLSFGLLATDPPPALAYFGSAPPDPEARPADALLIFAPGQQTWRDTHARRFRYALLIGVPHLGRVQAWELDPATAELLGPPPGEPAGVFGVRPPELRSAAEREVWDRLRR